MPTRKHIFFIVFSLQTLLSFPAKGHSSPFVFEANFKNSTTCHANYVTDHATVYNESGSLQGRNHCEQKQTETYKCCTSIAVIPSLKSTRLVNGGYATSHTHIHIYIRIIPDNYALLCGRLQSHNIRGAAVGRSLFDITGDSQGHRGNPCDTS